jgi:hypothetical protein
MKNTKTISKNNWLFEPLRCKMATHETQQFDTFRYKHVQLPLVPQRRFDPSKNSDFKPETDFGYLSSENKYCLKISKVYTASAFSLVALKQLKRSQNKNNRKYQHSGFQRRRRATKSASPSFLLPPSPIKQRWRWKESFKTEEFPASLKLAHRKISKSATDRYNICCISVNKSHTYKSAIVRCYANPINCFSPALTFCLLCRPRFLLHPLWGHSRCSKGGRWQTFIPT